MNHSRSWYIYVSLWYKHLLLHIDNWQKLINEAKKKNIYIYIYIYAHESYSYYNANTDLFKVPLIGTHAKVSKIRNFCCKSNKLALNIRCKKKERVALDALTENLKPEAFFILSALLRFLHLCCWEMLV